MEEIENFKICRTEKDLQDFQYFMMEKLYVIFLKYKGNQVNRCNLTALKYELKCKFPIVDDVKEGDRFGGIYITFDKKFLFSKNIIYNDLGNLKLNNDRFKLKKDNDRYYYVINKKPKYIKEMKINGDE